MARKRLKSPPILQGTKVLTEESTDNETPTWCLHHLRNGYSLADLEDMDACRRLHDALTRRSQIPWKELKRIAPESAGICVWDSKKIKGDTIPERFRGHQVRKFYCGGTHGGRVLGYRRGRVFEIVWIDFKFSLYDH